MRGFSLKGPLVVIRLVRLMTKHKVKAPVDV